MRRFLITGKRPVNKLCPSCRQPFEHPVQLFFDLNDSHLVGVDQDLAFESPQAKTLDLQTHPEDIYRLEHDDSDDDDDGNSNNILPDISYYEENMLTLQHSNDLLTAKLAEMERMLLVYHRRCEAQEEAKDELKRQIAELGSWLERVRRSEADKSAQIQELEERCRVCDNSIDELEEENNALSAENKHYQTLRITDEYYKFACFFHSHLSFIV